MKPVYNHMHAHGALYIMILIFNSIQFYFNTTYLYKVNSGVLTCKSKNKTKKYLKHIWLQTRNWQFPPKINQIVDPDRKVSSVHTIFKEEVMITNSSHFAKVRIIHWVYSYTRVVWFAVHRLTSALSAVSDLFVHVFRSFYSHGMFLSMIPLGMFRVTLLCWITTTPNQQNFFLSQLPKIRVSAFRLNFGK